MVDGQNVKKPKDPSKIVEVKIYFLPSELERINAFRRQHSALARSRNQLFHIAIHELMRQAHERGAVQVSSMGMSIAAESHPLDSILPSCYH